MMNETFSVLFKHRVCALCDVRWRLIKYFFLSFIISIFLYYRSIQCSRLSVHKNLVFAFILYYIVQIALLEPHINQRQDFYHHHIKVSLLSDKWVTKSSSLFMLQAYNVLISLHLLTKMSHTSWLFNEGFYLHSRITTSIFDSDAPFLFFHSVGWGK